jgi:hypothetical protein
MMSALRSTQCRWWLVLVALVLVPLQVALQLATFFRENWLKYAVSCVKRGENLASYTETSSAARRHTAGLLSAK